MPTGPDGPNLWDKPNPVATFTCTMGTIALKVNEEILLYAVADSGYSIVCASTVPTASPLAFAGMPCLATESSCPPQYALVCTTAPETARLS